MLLLATIALAVVTIPALAVATWPTRRRVRDHRAGPLVLPVVGTVPRIEEFSAYAGYGDRVVLSLAAGAPADVVAGAELVAEWYGFTLRVCRAGAAGATGPDVSGAAA